MTNGPVLYMDEFCPSDKTHLISSTALYSPEALMPLLRHLLQRHPPLSSRRRTMMIPKRSFDITLILGPT